MSRFFYYVFLHIGCFSLIFLQVYGLMLFSSLPSQQSHFESPNWVFDIFTGLKSVLHKKQEDGLYHTFYVYVKRACTQKRMHIIDPAGTHLRSASGGKLPCNQCLQHFLANCCWYEKQDDHVVWRFIGIAVVFRFFYIYFSPTTTIILLSFYLLLLT